MSVSWARRCVYETVLVVGSVKPEPSIFYTRHSMQKWDSDINPIIKPLIYNLVLPATFGGLMVAQNFWEWPSNDWPNMWSMPQERDHI